jgi:hypothetical protein
MDITHCKIIILFLLLSGIAPVCSAQDNSTKPKRFSVSASALAKKDLFYSTGTLRNDNNLYQLKSKIQPIVAVNLNTRLTDRLSLNTGFQVSTTNYSMERKYRSPELEFDGELLFRLLSYKLPVTLQYDVSNRLAIGGGLALNNQRMQSTSLKSSFEAYDGTYSILAMDSTVFRDPTFTVSAQLIAQLKLTKRSSVVFQADIDLGTYPPVYLTHSINNNGTITNSVIKGSPHLASVAVGYNILLFRK